LSAYALLVSSTTLMAQTGGDARDLGKYVGQMSGVCQTLGWRAQS
jgi:hypothetical protein